MSSESGLVHLTGFLFHLDGESVLLLVLPGGNLDLSRLTPAQRLITLDVVSGKSNIQIAHDRNISPRTVANHLAAIFRKLGVGSRAQLVARLSGAATRHA